MIITLDYIENAFEKYNKKYFNGTLVKPSFVIMHKKRVFGTFNRTLKYDELFGEYRWKFTISISDYYERSEFEFNNTIIHEMIHQYIRQNNLKDTSTHGRIFKSECERINKDGWKLSTYGRSLGCRKNSNRRNDITHNVCLYYNPNNGKHMLFCYVDGKKTRYMNLLGRLGVDKYCFFESKDEIFDSFVVCRSRIRGLYVEEHEKLKEYVKSFNNEFMAA